MVFYFVLFAISLGVLLKASDWFIDAAEHIGLSFGISPFIIGVTIVAFGTSLPELATSIASVGDGTSEVVVGNVVGSNITNIALVLGIVAVFIGKIELDSNVWHRDMPYLWASAFMLWLVVNDLKVSLMESLLLFSGIIVFLLYSGKEGDRKVNVEYRTSWRHYSLLALGGALVWLSADYTIMAIVKISELAGIDSELIALSAVALGTSLPEIIVSLNAARKGKANIAVGNVLGSNVFNTFVVMSVPSFFGPLVIPENIVAFYLPLMIILTVLFGIMINNKSISRWEGAMLLLFYAFFLLEIYKNAV